MAHFWADLVVLNISWAPPRTTGGIESAPRGTQLKARGSGRAASSALAGFITCGEFLTRSSVMASKGALCSMRPNFAALRWPCQKRLDIFLQRSWPFPFSNRSPIVRRRLCNSEWEPFSSQCPLAFDSVAQRDRTTCPLAQRSRKTPTLLRNGVGNSTRLCSTRGSLFPFVLLHEASHESAQTILRSSPPRLGLLNRRHRKSLT